ncbi:MAG: hypothetical protein NTZ02_04895, partial [Candidatus Woesearchaeota archaeon]|nr:hypothetical protein [Candidatus Woesearchaeota archaeon]
MKIRKGAELSVNVIIIAIVALVVLVVLFAIFTGRMNIFSKGLNCEQVGTSNHCKTSCGTDESIVALKCPTTGQFCCGPATS